MSDELPEIPAAAEPLPEITPLEIAETSGATDPDTALAKRLGRTGPGVLRFTLRDLLVITYAVPAERLKAHVPENLPLDMLPNVDGDRVAFIQTLCAFHENARWAALPEKAGGQSFHQITYRVLTRRAGRRGGFALRISTSTDEGRAAQRALSRDADFARFSVYIAGDPARATYTGYTLRATGDQGQTQIDARVAAAPEDGSPVAIPAPFASSEEAAAYFVDRPDNYFRASAPKAGIGLLPIHYGALPAPTFAELKVPPRLSLWTSLKLLTPDELQKPHSLMIFPAIDTTSFTPQFARLNRK